MTLSAAKRAHAGLARLPFCVMLIAPTLDVDLQLELAAAGRVQPATRVSEPRASAPANPADQFLRLYREAAKGSDHRRVLAIAHAVAGLPDGPRAEALYEMARRHSLLGERESAFACLTRAVDAGFADAGRLVADSAFTALRGDKPFSVLLARISPAKAPCRSSPRVAVPRHRPAA